MTDIMISLRPRFSGLVYSGRKTVELRRRRPTIADGAIVWIYTTSPEAKVEGFAQAKHVVSAPLRDFWTRYATQTGVSHEEFVQYFDGLDQANGIVLGSPVKLEKPITLSELRATQHSFHPPQFFHRLSEQLPVLHQLRAAI